MLNVGSLPALSRIAVAILPFTLFLYSIATLTTIAGMELFGWASGLLVLFVLWSNLLRPVELRPPFPSSKILDGALLALFLVVTVGAFVMGENAVDTMEIVGRARWVFLFLLVRTGLAWIWTENFTMILDFLIAIFALIVIYTIFQHFMGFDFIRGDELLSTVSYIGGNVGYRVSAFFSSPVTWGHTAALVIGYPASLFLLGAKRHTGFHWYLAAAVILTGLSVIMTFSFGAWAATAASLLIVCLYANRLAFLALLVTFAALGTGLYFVSPEVNSKVTSIASGAESESSSWDLGMKAWAESPWFGSGFGKRAPALENTQGSWSNTYLDWLIGAGAIGLFFYLIFVLAAFWLSQRIWMMIPSERASERALVLGVIGAQVALHVGGFFDSNFRDAEVSHLFLFSLAMLWALYNFYAHEHGLRIVRPRSERAEI